MTICVHVINPRAFLTNKISKAFSFKILCLPCQFDMLWRWCDIGGYNVVADIGPPIQVPAVDPLGLRKMDEPILFMDPTCMHHFQKSLFKKRIKLFEEVLHCPVDGMQLIAQSELFLTAVTPPRGGGGSSKALTPVYGFQQGVRRVDHLLEPGCQRPILPSYSPSGLLL
jgi:hypothetical protein